MEPAVPRAQITPSYPEGSAGGVTIAPRNERGRTSQFSSELGSQVIDVKQQTAQLTDSLRSVLERAKQCNDHMVKASQATLSELQFQDPMAQKLQQTEFNVGNLQQLIALRECDDVCLADIDPVVGRDGSLERETGMVDLF